MKLCIMGFDGLDSQLFEMSNLYWLKYFRENGQWGTLYSEAMVTGPCWSTILSGWNIETHGITHLLGMPLNGSNWFNGRPNDYIFDVLNEYNYSVGVANFPSLLYARKVNGWMLAGWPNQPNIYPHTIKIDNGLYSDFPDHEERFLFNRRPKGAMKDWGIHQVSWEEYIEFAGLNAFKRMKFIESLPEIDILMVQESVLDRAFHMLSTPSKGRLGTEDQRYKEALSLVNSIIGYIIENHKPEYLSIVSDHGEEGLSEASPNKGCWHSHRGTWALVGPDIVATRNNTDQVNYMPTILDALNINVERDGHSVLIKRDEQEIRRKLEGLGYI